MAWDRTANYVPGRQGVLPIMSELHSRFSDQVDVWCALRTGARWEKSVVEQLHAAGVQAYLPLMTRVSRSKSKRQTAEVPLFSGYVFCDVDQFRDNPRVGPACRQKIAQLLVPPDPDLLKNELRSIALVLNDRRLIQERFYGQIGDAVRVTGGPFTGAIGKIIRLKPGTSRIVLVITFLGAEIEAELEEAVLQKELASRLATGELIASTRPGRV